MNFFSLVLLATFFYSAAPLAADTLTVTVTCSNGQRVAGLPITVYDASGQQIPDANVTDTQGVFVIENSEIYSSPFSLFFTSRQGSSCGSYNVIVNGPGVGFVSLNYYPVELPCSCSKLIE